MTNEEIIDRFEDGAAADNSFHHADHVRLAFAYLSQYPPLPALEKFSRALKQFTATHGKPNLYHETITHSYFFLIRERMARAPVNGWEEFALANPDLFQWKGGILDRYYHEATLQSDIARSIFVFPDKVG